MSSAASSSIWGWTVATHTASSSRRRARRRADPAASSIDPRYCAGRLIVSTRQGLLSPHHTPDSSTIHPRFRAALAAPPPLCSGPPNGSHQPGCRAFAPSCPTPPTRRESEPGQSKAGVGRLCFLSPILRPSLVTCTFSNRIDLLQGIARARADQGRPGVSIPNRPTRVSRRDREEHQGKPF